MQTLASCTEAIDHLQVLSSATQVHGQSEQDTRVAGKGGRTWGWASVKLADQGPCATDWIAIVQFG